MLSWLFLRGACRECRKPIPVRYPLVELLTGVLAAASVWHLGFGVTGIAAAAECFTVENGLITGSVLVFDRLSFAPPSAP